MNIGILGSYLPRKCGIGVFSHDLYTALTSHPSRKGEVSVIAMADLASGYRYPPEVGFEILEDSPTEYSRTCDFISMKKLEVLIVQHEFGIFGGPSGSYLFELLDHIRIPVVTTLHTVLIDPEPEQRAIIKKLAKVSFKVVVMSHVAEQILREVYDVAPEKIRIIPHGIPDVPFSDTYFYKGEYDLAGKQVIMTFGLLSPSKGLEHMIGAMPEVIAKHPNAVYLILGATHPGVIRAHGESYRISLKQQAQNLGIQDNIRFFNQFVDRDTLNQFLAMSDIYVTPYPNRDQISSGALSFALGAGKAIVSTPFHHARELLADDRGILVPPEDSRSLASAICKLLDDEDLRNGYRKAAYQYARYMIWPEVGGNYLTVCEEAKAAAQQTIDEPIKHPRTGMDTLPRVKLDHMVALTDSTGIIQHAHFAIGNRNHGYCADDNARALIVCALLHHQTRNQEVVALARTYLAFLIHAFNEKKHRFRNFMSYERTWLEEVGSEDSHGRALWGLGVAIRRMGKDGIQELIYPYFIRALDPLPYFEHPKAIAFSLIGLHNYLKVYSGDARARRLRQDLANKLMALCSSKDPDWPWYEPELTYCSTKVPHAILLSGWDLGDEQMLDRGMTILAWLARQQISETGTFSAIGNNGWLRRDGYHAKFDQQPVEAMAMVEASCLAYRITEDPAWLNRARSAMDWFLGQNDINTPLYDFASGGCCDGLESQGVNRNMGAESTLAALISILTLRRVYSKERLAHT